MRTDAIERALMANDASLLAEMGKLDRTAIVNPEPVESEMSAGLPAFPEIAWRGIFADYREAMTGTTEASDVAHFSTCWAAAAVAMGRRVYTYAGDRTS